MTPWTQRGTIWFTNMDKLAMSEAVGVSEHAQSRMWFQVHCADRGWTIPTAGVCHEAQERRELRMATDIWGTSRAGARALVRRGILCKTKLRLLLLRISCANVIICYTLLLCFELFSFRIDTDQILLIVCRLAVCALLNVHCLPWSFLLALMIRFIAWTRGRWKISILVNYTAWSGSTLLVLYRRFNASVRRRAM